MVTRSRANAIHPSYSISFGKRKSNNCVTNRPKRRLPNCSTAKVCMTARVDKHIAKCCTVDSLKMGSSGAVPWIPLAIPVQGVCECKTMLSFSGIPVLSLKEGELGLFYACRTQVSETIKMAGHKPDTKSLNSCVYRKTSTAREIGVRAIHDEVREHFNANFTAECGLSCGNEISLGSFWVLSHDRRLTLTCFPCFQADTTAELRTSRQMDRVRLACWFKVNGIAAVGTCFACQDSNRPIHLLADQWHVGHDYSASKGGKRNVANTAPLHADCNGEQGRRTFVQYAKDVGSEHNPVLLMNDKEADAAVTHTFRGYRNGRGRWKGVRECKD